MDPRYPQRASSSYERNDVKALPRPPMASRAKSCFRKCRLGAVFAIVVGIVACVLGFAVVLAGRGGGGAWMEEWALKVCFAPFVCLKIVAKEDEQSILIFSDS